MELIKEIKRLSEVIDNAKSIVFLGGAGISTESGVSDFRSDDGLYNQPHKFSPEKILSHNFFLNQPKIFYEFYLEKIVNIVPVPNAGHYYLKELEEQGKLKAVITQNIDGLHLQAGSKTVYEIHGTVHKNHCIKCNKFFDLDYIKAKGPIAIRCDVCDGLVKPDVVLYNEPLDSSILEKAIEAIQKADLLIVGGTSLNVYPAADLLRYANKILLINLTRTSKDIYCDYVYYGKFGETSLLLKEKEV